MQKLLLLIMFTTAWFETPGFLKHLCLTQMRRKASHDFSRCLVLICRGNFSKRGFS